MDLRIFTEPQQGGTYDQQLGVALAAERAGFGAFFRSDHFTRIGPGGPGVGPTDSWVTLGALARETSTIRLGTLVTSATFRRPGPLAVAVAQVDQMSGGRVELGIGSGWYEREHKAYGIPFVPLGERFDVLEEQLQIITGLWDTPAGKTFDFESPHYRIENSPALPKPVQHPHPPIIIGGGGPRRTPALAARYANEYNSQFAPPAAALDRFAAVRGACEAAGRNPDELTYSVAVTVFCGRDDDELRRRVEAVGFRLDDQLRADIVAGTPDQVVARLKEYGEAGAERAYLQVLDQDDLDHVALLGDEVLPNL